jgi:hypothetical protein
MRNLVWIILAVVVLAGGYMLFTGKTFQDMADMAGLPDSTVAEQADEAAEETGAAVEETAETATETADEAVDAAAETAGDAAEAAGDAVTDAAEETAETAGAAAEEAADAAADAAGETVEAAEQAASEAADAMDGAAADGATSTAGGGTGDTPEVLTVEGFDLARVKELIAQSDIDTVRKDILTESLEQASGDEALLRSALRSVRDDLGY